MEKLSVFDLDGTLLPYDSYRAYIRQCYLFGVKRRLFLGGCYLCRRVGILSSGRLKESIVKRVRTQTDYPEEMQDFSQAIAADLSGRALELFHDRKREGDVVVLLSASPDDYVGLLGNRLGCTARGSHFDTDGRFVHLHGANKIQWLRENYPANRFDYNIGVSDCPSDLHMLKLFKEGWLYDGHELIGLNETHARVSGIMYQARQEAGGEL